MWLVSKAPPSTVAGSSLVISNCLSGDDKLDNILEKLGRLEVSGFLKEAYANFDSSKNFVAKKFKFCFMHRERLLCNILSSTAILYYDALNSF